MPVVCPKSVGSRRLDIRLGHVRATHVYAFFVQEIVGKEKVDNADQKILDKGEGACAEFLRDAWRGMSPRNAPEARLEARARHQRCGLAKELFRPAQVLGRWPPRLVPGQDRTAEVAHVIGVAVALTCELPAIGPATRRSLVDRL